MNGVHIQGLIQGDQLRRILRAALCLMACALMATDVAGQTPPDADAGLMIRSTLLQPFVSGQRHQKDPVAKRILDSDVRGCQTTLTDVRLEVIPDSRRAHLQIVSNGFVQSQTTSRNSQVLIESMWQHQFEIIKPVFFDGRQLLTQTGYGTIQARQTPQRVVSAFSASPLFGRLADQIAWQQVVRRSPLIDQAVAADLSTDILPKIDQEADRELAVLSQRLQELQQSAAALLRMESDDWHAATENGAVLMWVSPDPESTPPGSLAESASLQSLPQTVSQPVSSEDVVFWVSDRLVNRLISQIVKPGTMITDTELSRLLQSSGNADGSDERRSSSWADLKRSLVQLQRSPSQAEASVFSLKLAETDPVRVSFEQGGIRLRSTFEVIPRLGPSSGLHTSDVVFRGLPLGEDQWTVVRSQLSTLPGDNRVTGGPTRSDPEADHLLRMETTPEIVFPDSSTRVAGSVWPQLIQATTEKMLDQLPLSVIGRQMDLQQIDPRFPRLRLQRIQSRAGVLRISWSTIP